MKKFKKLDAVIAVLTFLLVGNSVFAAGVGNNIAVRLLGTATAYSGTDLFDEYDMDGSNSLCWDFDMLDVKTGNSIGAATDCAEIIGIVETELGYGYQVIGTTFFYFPGGTVVSTSNTTVMPVIHGSPDFTHITGDVPAEGTNNVLYGDRKFKSATGTVRFSGAGDFSTVFDDGVISIDCLFTLDIKTGAN